MLTGEDFDFHCHSNLVRAVAPYGLTEFDVHDVLNVFQCTGLNRADRYFMSASPAKTGDHLEFFAEIDLLCALSTCPGGDLSVPLWGPDARDPIDVCRPLGVEVYALDPACSTAGSRRNRRPTRARTVLRLQAAGSASPRCAGTLCRHAKSGESFEGGPGDDGLLVVAGLATTALVTRSAREIAGDKPYCIQVADSQADYRRARTLLELSGLMMRAKIFDQHHAVLVVGDETHPGLFHWSYHKARLSRVCSTQRSGS